MVKPQNSVVYKIMSFDPKTLLTSEIKDFIAKHAHEDVAALALKKPPHSDWPYPAILDQIKARQKAAKKLPNWTKSPDIIFPAPDLIEQASSQACANFKASLFSGQTFADLTAGAGIDTIAFAQNFKHGVCVDKSEHTTQILCHNFETIGVRYVAIQNQDAAEAIQIMDKKDLIFIDPQRRDKNNKGFVNIQDYSPNTVEMLPELQKKCDTLLIKASPMLDLWQAAQDLEHVGKIFIIEWQGECKELLLQCNMRSKTPMGQIKITAVTISDDGKPIHEFSFTKNDEDSAEIQYALPKIDDNLYEPGPALLKSGAFKSIAARHNLKKLHPHTHLYVANQKINELAGRWFKITDIKPVNRKYLDIKKANLTIRNFPDNVENLRKTLRIKEGGDTYIFACTLKNEQKTLLIAKKT